MTEDELLAHEILVISIAGSGDLQWDTSNSQNV